MHCNSFTDLQGMPRRGRGSILLASAIASSVAATVLAGPALAEPQAQLLPETVVSANRVETPSKEVGSSVTVITGEEMEERQIRVVADALRDVPGVSVNRTGPRGLFTQVRIRGNEGNHTKVFIDGVEANDPSGDVEFDFANLLAADIERVEIIRGPQSALWGSDAIGGVINVITKRGESGMRVDGYLEAGSFDTVAGNAAVRGAGKNYRYAASGSFLKTEGVNMSRFGSEKDGYKNGTINLSGGIDPTDNLELSANGLYIANNVESDPQDFTFGGPFEGLFVDGDEERNGEQFYGRAQGKLKTFGGQWEHIFGGNYTHTDFKNTVDQMFSTKNTGTKSRVDYQSNVYFSTPRVAAAEHTATLYAEYTRETFENESATFAAANQSESMNTASVAGEYLVNLWQRVFLTGSLRFDDNDLFKNATTYRVTGAYLHHESNTRLHASMGTGVKNPGFFDLFGFFPGTFIGNPNLNPEDSWGWDVGYEQKFFRERLVLDLTYFRSVLNDEIVTVFLPGGPPFLTTVANQTGASNRQGIELSGKLAISKDLSLIGAYTWTDATDPDGRQEVRRPEQIASLVVNYLLPSKRGNVNLNIQYNGPMEDNEFSFSTPRDRVNLPSFTLVTLASAYNVNKNVQLFGRIENLLNQNYEEVWSAQSPGIGVYAGVRLNTEIN
jgi:vitamin B12 transporter